MNQLLDRRNTELRWHATPLPGSRPYDNFRPINIPARLEGRTLFECVLALYPQIEARQWEDWFSLGQILCDGVPARRSREVRGGEQFWHWFPDTTEPEVDADIRVIWEDPHLVGLDKPAPLPVHPCGRFHRNTLTYFMDLVYGQGATRLVHRLDANTSGVMVLARSKRAASQLQHQFEKNLVSKKYVARILGQPEKDRFACDARISRQRSSAGGRSLDPKGLEASTEFAVIKRFRDGTTLVEAAPLTGRTNQIRIHLWALGMPIAGDPTYLPDRRYHPRQTLTRSCPRMCLHASSLTFSHPEDGAVMTLAAPQPNWSRDSSEISSAVSSGAIGNHRLP